jgi:hypothetical protein
MRDLKIFAPSDCTVSNTSEENEQALKQIGSVLEGISRDLFDPQFVLLAASDGVQRWLSRRHFAVSSTSPSPKGRRHVFGKSRATYVDRRKPL